MSESTQAERMKKHYAQIAELKNQKFDIEESPLHEAASDVDLPTVERLLNEGADVNGMDWFGTTPLMRAVQSAGTAKERAMFRDRSAAKLAQGLMGSLQKEINSEQPGEMIRSMTSMLPSTHEVFSGMREARQRRRNEADSDEPIKPSNVIQEETDLIRFLISRGADLEARDEGGTTALAAAASGGIVLVAELLLDAGAMIDAEDNDEMTPLMLAAKECKLEMVEFLIDRGANTSLVTSQGSVLFSAAKSGSRKIVARLLQENIEVNERLPNGGTALLVALMDGYEDVAKQLKDAGARTGFFEAVVEGDFESADKFAKDEDPWRSDPNWGRPVVFWTARESKPDVIRYLHAHGANFNVVDQRGRGPMMQATMHGNADTLQALIEVGSDPNPKSAAARFSPLSWAASRGDIENARLLIERGADINAETELGGHPLVNAVMNGHVEIARLLLETGADPNKSDTMPPMAFAAMRGDTEMVKLLVQYGANDQIQRSELIKISADVLPGVKDNPEMMQLLRQAGGTEIHEAVKAGDEAEVRKLITQGRDVNTTAPDGRTALREAIESNRLDMAVLLLENCADPNIPDIIGRTPLHAAVQRGYLDLTGHLLSLGAEIDVCSKRGFTPLATAALIKDEARRDEAISFLLRHGAAANPQEAAAIGDIDTLRQLLDLGRSADEANSGGVTALIMAATMGHTSIIQMLLTRHAYVNHRDESGETALTKAMMRGNEEAARLLLENGADIEGSAPEDVDADFDVDFSITRTPLQASVYSGKIEMVRLAIEHGANPDGRGMKGKTVLHTAIHLPLDKLGIVEYIIDQGADVNAADWSGHTPLMSAAITGKLEMVELLIRKGADPSAKTVVGQTALSLARQALNSQPVVDILNRALGVENE